MPKKVAFCAETRNRIRVAVAAYAYEVENASVMSDAEFDALCNEIDPTLATARAAEDEFFLIHFEPHTGSWIHKHPDLPGIRRLYRDFYKDRQEPLDDDWKDLV